MISLSRHRSVETPPQTAEVRHTQASLVIAAGNKRLHNSFPFRDFDSFPLLLLILKAVRFIMTLNFGYFSVYHLPCCKMGSKCMGVYTRWARSGETVDLL
jgi:hypothetical protein